MKTHISQKHNIGFTLIETLVAITILVTATAGPMVVASQGAQLGRHSKDQMVASYLAQDAIEYVRYVIATGSEAGLSRDAVLSVNYLNRCTGTNVCQIDTSQAYDVSAAITTCALDVCADLKWDPTNLEYNYIGSEDTIYNREIRVRNTGSGPGGGILHDDTEYTVSVIVSWNDGAESLEITDRLVDWRVVY
jgi:type II secretory pathway pseudopilin PulG